MTYYEIFDKDANEVSATKYYTLNQAIGFAEEWASDGARLEIWETKTDVDGHYRICVMELGE